MVNKHCVVGGRFDLLVAVVLLLQDKIQSLLDIHKFILLFFEEVPQEFIVGFQLLHGEPRFRLRLVCQGLDSFQILYSLDKFVKFHADILFCEANLNFSTCFSKYFLTFFCD